MLLKWIFSCIVWQKNGKRITFIIDITIEPPQLLTCIRMIVFCKFSNLYKCPGQNFTLTQSVKNSFRKSQLISQKTRGRRFIWSEFTGFLYALHPTLLPANQLTPRRGMEISRLKQSFRYLSPDELYHHICVSFVLRMLLSCDGRKASRKKYENISSCWDMLTKCTLQPLMTPGIIFLDVSSHAILGIGFHCCLGESWPHRHQTVVNICYHLIHPIIQMLITQVITKTSHLQAQ